MEQEPIWSNDLLFKPHSAEDKARRVRRMFNAIAKRYRLVNSVFSVGRDKAWRQRAVVLSRAHSGDMVLDVACGTGDLARSFSKAHPTMIVGCDFARDMLALAQQGSISIRNCFWCEGDALRLPFQDCTFTIAACAFGVRNFQDLEGGLREMYRVLQPGGRIVILEFTKPRGAVMKRLCGLYTDRLMPTAASWMSGDRTGAYYYLPQSVESFLTAEEMLGQLQDVGFVKGSVTPLTFGVVTIYLAYRDGL